MLILLLLQHQRQKSSGKNGPAKLLFYLFLLFFQILFFRILFNGKKPCFGQMKKRLKTDKKNDIKSKFCFPNVKDIEINKKSYPRALLYTVNLFRNWVFSSFRIVNSSIASSFAYTQVVDIWGGEIP